MLISTEINLHACNNVCIQAKDASMYTFFLEKVNWLTCLIAVPNWPVVIKQELVRLGFLEEGSTSRFRSVRPAGLVFLAIRSDPDH